MVLTNDRPMANCIKPTDCGTYGRWTFDDTVEKFSLFCSDHGPADTTTFMTSLGRVDGLNDEARAATIEADKLLSDLESAITPVSNNWMWNRASGEIKFA